MADLTQNLPNANSTRRIIDPGKEGPTWLEGAANLASGLITGGSRLYEQNEADNRQRAADVRRQQEDEKKAREDTAKDRLAAVLWGARDQQSQGLENPLADNETDYPVNAPVDSSLEGAPLPEGVTGSIDEVRRAQTAENQGRAPSGSSRVVLERNLTALMAEFPDQQFEIFKALQEAGFDHYLFREMETEQKLQEADVNQEIAQRNSYANVAIENGLVPVGTDPNTAAGIGQQFALEASRAKRLRELEEAARAGDAEARAQYQFEKTKSDDDARRNFGASLSAVITPRWGQLTNLLSQANGSQEALNLIPDAIRDMDIIVENHIAAARQNGASEEVINSMRADWDNMKKSTYDYVSGPPSEVGVAKAALEGIQTRLGMNIAQALPTYTALKEIFGATALSEFFGVDGGLSLTGDMLEQARTELKGIQGAIDTDQERVSLATVAQMLRGNLQINQLTEAQARQVVPALVSTSRGQAREIREGRGNITSFTNSNLQLYNAAMELQPGARVVNQEIAAAAFLFNNDQRQALTRLHSVDKESAEILTRSGRAAATHLLQNLENHQLTAEESMGGAWTLVKREDGLGWRPELSRAAYARWAQSQRGTGFAERGLSSSAPLPSYEQMRAAPPRALSNLLRAKTEALDYLVWTTTYDPEFQGVTANEARLYYRDGRVPTALMQRQQREQEARMSFGEQANALRRGLAEDRTQSQQIMANEIGERIASETPLPRTEVQRMVRDEASKFGLDWDLVGRLVGKESGWQTAARNGTTGASGLFQINDNVARDLSENIQTGLNMLKDADQAAKRILGDRATNADTYVMYQQGPGGGAALLQPANAGRLAVDVLKEAYRGNVQLARQAITANGGNLDMTAAEFAQSIRNYFNR